MRGEHEVHGVVLGQVHDVAVRAGNGLVRVGARIQLVKNAEVPNRGAKPPSQFVQNLLAPAGLRLEQAVAPRRVGDVQVAVQLVVGADARACLVEPVPQLLRKQDVQHCHFENGGFSGRVRARDDQALVQRHRVSYGAQCIIIV